MLHCEHVVFGYGKKSVIDGLSLQALPAFIHGLVGFNGSGKTTLLELIYGRLRCLQGNIYWNGQHSSLRHIAFLETENYFYHYITGREYLAVFAENGCRMGIEQINERFRLPLQQRVERYSTGMKKKLAFAAIYNLDRELYIMDEPFNGVDMEGVMLMLEAIRQLQREGRTVLLTSHILSSLTDICDSIHHLHEGRIVHSYTPEQYTQLQQNLQNTFEQKYQ